MSRSILRRPEVLTWVVIAMAWAALLAAQATGTPAVPPSTPPAITEVVARGWPMWVVMATAMMAPAATPAARHVAENSFRWRRHRAVLTFLGAYVAIWAVFGLIVVTALAVASRAMATPPTYRAALLVTMTIAIAWQVSPWKKGQLSRCRTSIPLAPYGWKAFQSCARFGARHGLSCVASCWAVMLVMAVAVTGHLWWTLALTGAVLAERWVTSIRANPRMLAGPGVLALAIVILSGGSGPSAQALTWICTLPPG